MRISNKNMKLWLAAAALIGLGVAGTGAAPAHAATFQTNCLGDDCMRVRCNDWGDNCVQIGYFHRDRDFYAPYHARYVCDADGGYCHWSQAPIYYERSGDYDEDYGD